MRLNQGLSWASQSSSKDGLIAFSQPHSAGLCWNLLDFLSSGRTKGFSPSRWSSARRASGKARLPPNSRMEIVRCPDGVRFIMVLRPFRSLNVLRSRSMTAPTSSWSDTGSRNGVSKLPLSSISVARIKPLDRQTQMGMSQMPSILAEPPITEQVTVAPDAGRGCRPCRANACVRRCIAEEPITASSAAVSTTASCPSVLTPARTLIVR